MQHDVSYRLAFDVGRARASLGPTRHGLPGRMLAPEGATP